MISLNYQQQLKLEERFSRKIVKKSIKNEFWQVYQDLIPIYEKGIAAIQKYIATTYDYKSKNDRINYLLFNTFEVDDLVDELYFSILFHQKTTIQKVATDIARYLDYPDLTDGIKTASEMIAVCVDTGLYDITLHPMGMDITALHTLPDHMLKRIQDTIYMPPMICDPKKVRYNTQSGYLTFNDSVILGKENHHNDEQSLDVINILNSISFSLNEDMLTFEEKPLKPFKNDDAEIQFKQMAKESRYLYNLMIKLGNSFNFNWKNDKRGRLYNQGYHIHLQAASYKKAILEFTEKEIIND